MPSSLRAPVEYRGPDAPATRPCAVCRTPVDPLRAPAVAHIAGGFKYYCSHGCFDRRGAVGAEPSAPSRAESAAPGDRPSVEQTADMLGISRDSLPSDREPTRTQRVRSSSIERPAEPDPPVSVDPRPAVASMGAALVAVSLNLLPGLPSAAVTTVSALAAFVSIAAAVRETWRLRMRAGGAWPAATLVLGPLLDVATAARVEGLGALAERLAGDALLASIVVIAMLVVRIRVRRAQLEAVALAGHLPRVARRLRADGSAEEIEPSSVRAGEEVRVEAGESIPVDGIVRGTGCRIVLHAGRDAARICDDGDSVLAGGRVVDGSVRVLATRAGDDVVLARLQRAWGYGADVPRTVTIAQNLARWSPLPIAGLSLAGAFAHGGLGAPWHLIALALGAAPCAVGVMLARVPLLESAVEAARRGIVFRDARSEERASDVGAVVLCLRGTVTYARPEFVEVVSLGAWTERELIALAAGCEAIVHDHPIARAITIVAREREVSIEPVRRPTYLPGRGILALNPAGEMVAVGSRQLLLDEGISVAPAEDIARAIEGQGRSAVFVAAAGRVEGVLGLQDAVREEVRPAVQKLMDAGFEMALLAGESRGTVEALAQSLDIANARPEVLPDERGAAVRSIAEVGGSVAVVGRPQRDGGALGAADVAISLAAAGESGGETAIALAGDDLRDAAGALLLARTARARVVRIVATSMVASFATASLVAFAPQIGSIGATLGALLVVGAAAVASRGGDATTN